MLGTNCFKAYGIVTRSKHCVTRDSSDYLTYKTKQNLNFPFYPFSHLFMPNQFFDKKKGQELKNTYVTSEEQG